MGFMSLVTNANQPSSNIVVRLEKLQNLYQVLTKNKFNQHISKVFTNLEKIDRHAICAMNSSETIGRKHIFNKIAMRNAVERHMGALKKKEIEVMKAGHSFTILSSKSVNYLQKLPIPLMSASIGSFLTEKERADLRSSCKDTRKIQTPAFSIIKTYKLEGLIETYFHVPCSALTLSDKAKTLHKLLSMAYNLSEIEELPRPSYSSLLAFFQEVEARNLIRMIEAIQNIEPLPKLLAGVEDLHIPNDPIKTIQKADRLRDWIGQHKDAIAAINGVLRLENKNLSLLPKEIGQLRALGLLYLHNNRLVSVPKEIGKLQALLGLYLHNNQLISIPKEIGQLQLQWLMLHNNRLIKVPKEIGRIKYVRLSNNSIFDLPAELEHFRDRLGEQRTIHQLNTVLNRLKGSLKGNHDCKSIAKLLNEMERIQGEKVRSTLHACTYEVCKSEKTLHKKLKSSRFGRHALIDPKIEPRLKMLALHRFKAML